MNNIFVGSKAAPSRAIYLKKLWLIFSIITVVEMNMHNVKGAVMTHEKEQPFLPLHSALYGVFNE